MKMSSRCAVLFFDEIDALGQTRSSSGDRNNVSGGETSARRILAELLIQLSKNYNQDDVDMIEEKMSRSDEDISHRENLQQKSPHSTLHLAMGRQVITPVDGNAPQSLEIDITEMKNDERKPRIIVIAATNRPEDCDPALLRRFHARILVGLPTKRDRKKIVSRLLSNIDHSLTDNHVLQIALATDGWSGSDLESLTREAVMTPIRECLQAAARIKASARKHNPKGELDSNPNHEIDLNRNSDRAARDALLAGFKSLRSVHIQDFEQAMAFWLGEDHFQILGETVTTKANTHYDSDSSSEDTNF
jgi:SpoVK/Ycf46/Vps4 family AAA+-type ATPase